MRVIIAQLLSNVGPRRTRVLFRAQFGTGIAYWYGEKPAVSQDCDVELQIDEIFVWGKTIQLAEENQPKINHEGHYLMIQGELEDIDVDGVACIRLGPSITMIETIGSAPPAGVFVQFKTADVTLYDTHI